MLSAEDNELLTQVGPGTPMGNLLRRYWTPACLSRELDTDGSPLEVRLLGEDLIAFRDTSGKVGLFDRACPHRGASMFYARNEECGLRCIYHGWKFDVDGKCVDMPSEPRPFTDRIQIPSYPVHESGGIVWTYMGPKETITPFRNFGSDDLAPELVQATKLHTTCNWVQSMEGNIDTAHISHLHQWFGIDDLPDDGSDKPGYPSNMMSWKFWRHDRSPRIEIQDEWYGFKYAGIRTTPNGNTHVRMSCYSLPYGTHVATIPYSGLIGMFVPIDDENSWRYVMVANPLPNPNGYGGPPLFAVNTPFTASQVGVTPPAANGPTPRRFTAENHYQVDRGAQKTLSFAGISDFVSQDLAVTESMGPVYDRRKEHLGSTDAAVMRMRSILLAAARSLAAGGEPPAVAGDLDYQSIHAAEKILATGEDWRTLGTYDDPTVQEGLLALNDAK